LNFTATPLHKITLKCDDSNGGTDTDILSVDIIDGDLLDITTLPGRSLPINQVF